MQSRKSDYKCASTYNGASCVPHKGSMGGLGEYQMIFSFLSSLEKHPSLSLTSLFTCYSFLSCMKKRFQNDMAINNSNIEVLQDQKWVIIPWKKLQVGDIVRVRLLFSCFSPVKGIIFTCLSEIIDFYFYAFMMLSNVLLCYLRSYWQVTFPLSAGLKICINTLMLQQCDFTG